MGYMRHHAIIVTSSDAGKIDAAWERAHRLFDWEISSILKAPANNYSSFFVPPDGSKEGWGESDLGDEKRELFISWLESQRFDDGSSAIDWVEVQYGDDNGETCIVRDVDEVKRHA